MGETVRIVRIDRPEETFTIGQLVRETRDRIYITNPETGADEWYDKSAFKILPVTQDYRISLEELDRVRHSCVEAGRMVQGFVDTEEARLGRRPHFYLPTVSPHETIKVPHSEQAMNAGAAGREIIAVACSVPPKDEIPYCEAVYVKDNGDCGVVRGPYAEVLPVEKHKWVGRG